MTTEKLTQLLNDDFNQVEGGALSLDEIITICGIIKERRGLGAAVAEEAYQRFRKYYLSGQTK